ncbi:hypothetical protein [Chitinimonas sp.]|uniref:hypothetical protein n=1 Tax=Chitinimonas sp. TaxID=1934313 RepID=UPI0035B2AA65
MSGAQAVADTASDSSRPAFPGSPYTPEHPVPLRLAYALVSVLLGICATLGNALVSVNMPALAGCLGNYVAEASLLPAIYVAMNAGANLSLVKARIQFGIPRVSYVLLSLYIAATLVQMAAPGLATAALVRGASGLAAAGLTTLTLYYALQAMPVSLRAVAMVVAIMLPSFGTPIARLFPVEFLAQHAWQGLHLIELGCALLAGLLITCLPLPKSDRQPAFEALDFVSIPLLLGAITLLCIVLGMGRSLWWADTPWLAWALMGSLILGALGLLIERLRQRPLLQLDWLYSGEMLRFAAVIFMVRLALAEQSYGSVGLLSAAGLNNEQFHTLFALVMLAMLAGVVVAVLTLSEKRLTGQVVVAALLIALGAWLDSQSNSLTRPEQLYISQMLIGFGTSLFIGPALLYGFMRMARLGPSHMISFFVLFSLTQNIGGLAGSALLGSYQTLSARAHMAALSEHLQMADVQVAARIQAGTAALGATVPDPLLRSAQGAASLSQAMAREANALAFNDVFRLVAVLALLTALYLGLRIAFNAYQQRQDKQGVSP